MESEERCDSVSRSSEHQSLMGDEKQLRENVDRQGSLTSGISLALTVGEVHVTGR